MITVAAGDSFIWGSELADSPHGGPGGYSHMTYPALLAGDDYVCAAYPGNANNAISRMAIAACEKIKEPKFLFVTWTYPQRSEFRFDDGWASVNSWHTNHKEFSENYFKHAGNTEYYEIYSVLKEIVFLQQYCQINKIPYLFMTADNHFYQHENYTRSRDADIDNLYNQIDWSRWFWFNPGTEANETPAPRGFYQWAVENKYKVGPQGHPLESAHVDAAGLIKEKFNELVKNPLG
jgi:hypothetical protein